MTDYEVYAFDPHNIAAFRPQRHQSRFDKAKELAIAMLEEVPSERIG